MPSFSISRNTLRAKLNILSLLEMKRFYTYVLCSCPRRWQLERDTIINDLWRFEPLLPTWPCSSGSRGSQLIVSFGGGDNPAMKEMDASTSLFSTENTQRYWHNHFDFVAPIILRLHSLPPLCEWTWVPATSLTDSSLTADISSQLARMPSSFRVWSPDQSDYCWHFYYYDSRHSASRLVLYRPRYIIDPTTSRP